MTTEAVIEKLEGLIRSDEDIDFFSYEEKKAMEEAIKVLKDDEWIPVEKRLPDDGHRVLLWFDGDYTIGAWCEDEHGFFHGSFRLNNVEAWREEIKPYQKGE